ncbi:MAG: glycosyltransferase [Kiritimatiellaeota bacterium]|nr:glycosyltransferase [Kiritimatiellota bacterium]
MKANATASVVIPVFNEQENLPELLERSLKACRSLGVPFEIVLVDDGSRDRSPDMLREAAEKNPGEIIAVLLNRNYGQHSAVMAGFAQAKGDVIISLDADLQNPPEEIPNLYRKLVSEDLDVVAGIRVPREDSALRKIPSWCVNRITQKATGVKMHDYGCMLRAYSARVVQAMLQCTEHSTFIPVLANSFAKRTAEIEVRHAARSRGDSKYSIFKLINLQFDLLTSMTTFPLRLLSYLGAVIAFFGVALGIFILIERFVQGEQWAAQGVFTLFAILFIFIGAQFVGMGLMGEYIGRIYRDVRGRPRYLVHEVKGVSRLAAP